MLLAKMFELEDISKSLTKEVIEKAFRSKTNSEDVVKYIEISRAAPIGEGLLSVVFRIRVAGDQHSTSFVAKALINDAVLRTTLDCPKYFKREADFFENYLPAMVQLQISLGAKERLQNNIAVCFCCHQDGTDDYILLEDLFESNCVSIPEFPSEEQRNRVLKTLAHLHAVSMAWRIQKPGEFDKTVNSLPELYYNEINRDWYTAYLERALNVDSEVVSEYDDVDSTYSKKFHAVVDNDPYSQLIWVTTTRGEHPVLCHGDAWGPNFLASSERTVAIDFQVCRCASPSTDLSYWLLLSCNEQTTKEDFLNAIDSYYDSIEYYLQDMGLDAAEVFPRKALDNELKLYGKFGFLAALTSFPLLAADKGNVLNPPSLDMFPGVDRIPLVSLWPLNPLTKLEDKLRLLNAIHLAVDVGFI